MSNDEVFYINTGVWPTPEMHVRLHEEIQALLKERDPSGTKTVKEVLTEADVQLLARRVAGLSVG